MERIRREISIQKLIKHPSVIQIYDVYETEKNLFLVLEYISGGELFDYIVNTKEISPTEARSFFQQIIYAVEHIHSFSITHRDLKPENLLLDENNNIKIADFGMAKIMETGNLLKTACGSPHYVAPEVLTGTGYDGKKSDIWACGVILFALLCGHLPFNHDNYHKLLLVVKRGVFQFPQEFVGEGAKDLIRKMLTVDTEKRITIKEIKRHPWFTYNHPTSYIAPLPPIDYGKDLEKPIKTKKIQLKILEELNKLGWMDPNEIINELVSNKPNTIKVFYKFFQKYNNSNQNFNHNSIDDDDLIFEKDNVKKAPRTKCRSLPLKKRRNTLNRKMKKNSNNDLNLTQENISGTSPVETNRVLQLHKLVEKTGKNKDLEMYQYSEIISTVNSFHNNENKKNKNYECNFDKKDENNILSAIKQRKKRSVSCSSSSTDKNHDDRNDQDNKKTQSKPITINRNKKLNPLVNVRFERNKPRGRSLGSTKSLSPKKFTGRNMKLIFNIGLMGRKKKKKNGQKQKQKKKRVKANESKQKKEETKIENENENNNNNDNDNDNGNGNDNDNDNDNDNKNVNEKKNENSDENGGNGENGKLNEKGNQNDNENENKNQNGNGGNDGKKDNLNNNTETKPIDQDLIVGTPRFQRNDNNNNDNENSNGSSKDLSQEDIDLSSKRWIDNFVSKKEQKKLNSQLKKKLKNAKKDLMKNLQQNQNLPIFICNDSIISVSSGDLFSVVSELQTALTILNYNWSYPNYITLKGQNGKFIIKIKIIQTNLNTIINLISEKMYDRNNLINSPKKKKKKSQKDKSNYENSQENQLELIKKNIRKQLQNTQNTQKRNWNMAIEFIWKTGSSKKFIEETENIIHFLSE
ncbi:protein kinase [Anaeramoeba flamelloides]|uniref:Protein kinase n=1 Tax=Anaeramoeba flamelloides TaxID=1746091 RepID=A0ABQ8XJD4_9EUKA|nr:protein kinase [Anaeramoeba flamelloides]